MGAGAIEQDVVMTRDDHLIVLHDIHLDTVTDVGGRYPDRARDDGRFYAIDFDLEEIQTLRATERFSRDTGTAVYGTRFPVGKGHFRIPTLGEEIEMIQGLNRSSNREVLIYVEFKAPAWHMEEGKDLGKALLVELGHYGYTTRADACYVQCFDPDALVRLRNDLKTDLKLVQLIGFNEWNESTADYEAMLTPVGMRVVGRYADGVGPHYSQLVLKDSDGGYQLKAAEWVRGARDTGLLLHPYTFRADDYPHQYFESFAEMIRFYASDLQVDGVFADHPDLVLKALQITP